MSGRESLLAEIEANRQATDADHGVHEPVELGMAADDNSYNPYDKPGHAKPLRLEARRMTFRRKKRRK